MIVAVAGSYDLTDIKLVESILNKSPFQITEVLSAHRRGVDAIVLSWALGKLIPHQWLLLPDGDTMDARLLRQRRIMAKRADALIVILQPGLERRYAKQLMKLFLVMEKPVWYVEIGVRRQLLGVA